jgi:hypothetical protein
VKIGRRSVRIMQVLAGLEKQETQLTARLSFLGGWEDAAVRVGEVLLAARRSFEHSCSH